MLPETFPHQKLQSELSQSQVDALCPIAKAGRLIRHVRVTQLKDFHFRLLLLRPQLSHHEGSAIYYIRACRSGLERTFWCSVTYSSVIASVGVALSAARELAIISSPCGPKIGVFALWLARVSHIVICSLRIKLTIQPSPGSPRRNLPLWWILFHQ